ncbi:DUF4224 domain-containing protein [Pandoraea sp. NPDC087047]|uniref:DUF4224 domain-containing protein n=1 Tax=Pandoraea sp. NPDC087047 TaxID=3364390 RepID=UPI003817A6BA
MCTMRLGQSRALAPQTDVAGESMMETFSTRDEVQYLTGRQIKTKQAEMLRRMGIPFFLNAGGRPIVARVAIEGRGGSVAVISPKWVPRVLGERHGAIQSEIFRMGA